MQTAEVVALKKQDLGESGIAIKRGLQVLADVLTYDITPNDVSAVYLQLKNVEDVLKDIGSLARDRLLAYIKQEGEPISEGGSLKARLGEYEVCAIIRSAGYDAKKVQQMLRSKGLDATAGCDTEIKYKPNPDKLEALVDTGRLTRDELKLCKVDPDYRVERPTRVSDE